MYRLGYRYTYYDVKLTKVSFYYYYCINGNSSDRDVQNIVVMTVRKIDSGYLNILKHVHRYKATATRRYVRCCTTVRLNSY